MKIRTVMVVDDDQDLREVLVIMLEAEGLIVIQAEHGRHALELMAIAAPHLIVLDLTMPVMDGCTFLAHKTKTEHATIPVVVFSSSLAAGIDSMASVETVVNKVEGMGALLEAIRRVVAKLAATPSPIAA